LTSRSDINKEHLAWNKYLQAHEDAKDGEAKLAQLREHIHANNDQELLAEVIRYVNVRAMRNAQLPLDAKVQRADQESDEIEEALGQLLASQTADCSPSSS
jgi:hypothetical protein